jgi:hypothetical protein
MSRPARIAIPSYIINYTPFERRRELTIETIARLQLGVTPVVVHKWDREGLNEGLQSCDHLWDANILNMLPILLGNVTSQMSHSQIKDSTIYKDLLGCAPPEWTRSRRLSRGELSVLLKHYYALASIAHSSHPYGLVVEDDVRMIDDAGGLDRFWEAINEAISFRVDYLDLAGGCNLHPHSDEISEDLKYIAILKYPRTRTSAAYLISKYLAAKVAALFMPLIFPIDWHMQYIFLSLPSIRCSWCINSVLQHGSELGLEASWRSE